MNSQRQKFDLTDYRRTIRTILTASVISLGLVSHRANSQSVLPPDQWAPCLGSTRPGGPCSADSGGGLYAGPGGGLYEGPGGGLYEGPGGGLYQGPGGGAYNGPGGGLYLGPASEDGYKGPWSPCFTGVFGAEWRHENCPGFSE